MNTRSSRYLIGLVSAVLLIIISGCGKKAAPPAPAPPQVGFITITPQPVSWTTQLPGRTDAEMTADVRPQVSGIILKRLFTEGSDVTAGQQLYQIDPALYQAAYDSAAKHLANVEKTTHQTSIDSAQGQLTSAQGKLKGAQAQVSYSQIRSPIDGFVTDRPLFAGETAAAAAPPALPVIW